MAIWNFTNYLRLNIDFTSFISIELNSSNRHSLWFINNWLGLRWVKYNVYNLYWMQCFTIAQKYSQNYFIHFNDSKSSVVKFNNNTKRRFFSSSFGKIFSNLKLPNWIFIRQFELWNVMCNEITVHRFVYCIANEVTNICTKIQWADMKIWQWWRPIVPAQYA